MLLINLDIMKSFINDRNSFTIEERKNLGLNKKIISTSNETQTPVNTYESMLNAPLDIGMNILQDNEETSITIPTNTSDRLFPNSTETQLEETNTQTEVQPFDRKDKICRKVMDETTLRIYFPRHVDTIDTISTIHNDAALPNLLERQHPVSALSQTKATVSLG